MKKRVRDALARETLQKSEKRDGAREPRQRVPHWKDSGSLPQGEVIHGVLPQEGKLQRLGDPEKGAYL